MTKGREQVRPQVKARGRGKELQAKVLGRGRARAETTI
jgi:hypothetical protein